MKILLLGGTGVAGRSTLPRLLTAGHHVTAHARSEAAAGHLAEVGADVARFDSTDPAALRTAMRGQQAVVDHRVAIPSTARAALPGAWRTFRRLRDQATGELVDAMLDAGVDRLVRDLVTFVYADGGDGLLEEGSPVSASGAMAANLAAERHVTRITAAGGAGLTLRCGLFYGPDDAMSTETVRLSRRGLALIVGPGQAWHSALHTDDIGPAVLAALTAPPGTYNVVDDEPLRRADLISLLAAAAGRQQLRRPPRFTVALGGAPARAQARSHRVSAAHFRNVTGWRPGVPTRRMGWPAVFQRPS